MCFADLLSSESSWCIWSSSITPLVERRAAGALAELDAAIAEGADVGQVIDQLLGYFRDMMAAVVGCDANTMLHTDAADFQALAETGKRFGLETVR